MPKFECESDSNNIALAYNKSTIASSDLKLNYKGNKNHREKNKYSEAPEVLKKNLIRSLRRYLTQLYTSDYNHLNKPNKSMQARKMRVQTFYEKHFKSQTCSALGLSDDEELGVLHVLSMFTPEGISFRNDTKNYRNIKYNLNKLIKTYSKKLSQSVIAVDGFKHLLNLVKQAGHMDKMIEAYSILAKSKEAYEDAMQNMIQD